MPSPPPSDPPRSESPDPASHAANVYDSIGTGGDLDDEDDDDMDFEPATDESDDIEYFDPSEDVEADFHGRSFLNFDLHFYGTNSE